MKKDSISIEISIKSLFVITAFFLLMLLVWQLRMVFVMLFVAFIIKSAIRPYIDYFEEKNIPRVVSTLTIYILLFLGITIVTVTLFSDTIEQLRNLISLMPQLIANILNEFVVLLPWLGDVLDPQKIQDAFVNDISNVTRIFTSGVSSAVNIINSAFGIIGVLVAIITVSVYMLIRKEEVYSGIIKVIPIKSSEKDYYADLIEKVELKLGAWMRAQLFLMIFIGVLTWIGLTVPALFIETYQMNQYALPIAFVASVMEGIPSIGPVLTAVFAIVVAVGSGSSFAVVIYIVLLFVAIQQLEGLVVVPKLMEKVIGLDPILTIVSVIGAFLLFGFVGAILIVPVLAVIQIVFESQLERYQKSHST